MSLDFRGRHIPLPAFNRLRHESPSAPRERTDRSLALALFALLYTVYLATFSGVYHSSDERAMLVATDSLARRGAWDTDLLRWMGEQQGSFGPDGHLYSRKGIGLTLAALPHYWLALHFERLGNVQVAMLTNSVLTALTAVLVFLSLRRLYFGQGVSLLAALAYGLGTMAWPYARYFYSESLAALGLMLAFYFLLRFRDRAGALSVILAGAGLGVALLARLNNALAAPFLGLLLLTYLYRRHGRHWREYIAPLLLFALPLLAALTVTAWYNWIRFGDPLTTGYLPQESFSAPFFQGLYGLTLSAGKGLFWYNPLLIAAAAAWPAFYKRSGARAEALLAAAIVLSTVLFYAPWYLWWAGHGWGPRFLVSLLPFAALPLAAAFELAAGRRALTVALGALAAASVAVQILGVAVDYNLYLEDVYARLGLYHPATLFDPAYSPLIRQWAYLRLANLDLAWAHIAPGWSAVLWALMLVALGLVALWSAWARRPAVWSGWVLVVLLVGLTLPCLLAVGPEGDVASAGRELAALEQPGQVAVLPDSLLTDSFQNAYDGRLPLWALPDRTALPPQYAGTWLLATGPLDPAPLHFQAGPVALAFYPAPGQAFDAAGLPSLPAGFESAPALDGVAELVGVTLERDTVECSSRLPVTTWWRALSTPDISYTLFVQVIDQAGTKAGQADRLPCAGACPTTSWRPGDLVGERVDIAIDCAAPPGRYQVIAGLYDLDTGSPLTVVDAAGHPMGGYVVLGTVDVRP